jgi:hypothetical protein
MSDYELTLRDFQQLVANASRHHLKQIAAPLAMTVHTRGGKAYFRDAARRELSLDIVHARVQADPEVRRWAYNLYMSYFR